MGDKAIPAVQVWVDRHYPDAYRCPRLLAFIDKQGAEHGAVALIRYNEADGFVLLPPSLTKKGWVERRDTKVDFDASFGVVGRLQQMREEQAERNGAEQMKATNKRARPGKRTKPGCCIRCDTPYDSGWLRIERAPEGSVGSWLYRGVHCDKCVASLLAESDPSRWH